MDNEIEKIIGRNIRRLREGCGLTQEMLFRKTSDRGMRYNPKCPGKNRSGTETYICGRNNNFKENIERTV